MIKGTVRKRGSSWQAILPYKDQSGKWKQASATARTEDEALAKLKQLNYDLSRNMNLDNPTLREVRDAWLREKRLSARTNTLLTYEATSETILKYLDKGVKDIERMDVVELFGKLKADGKEPKYFKTILSMIFNHAIQMKVISDNPVRGIKVIRTKPKRKPVVLSYQQRREVLEFTKGSKFYYPIRIALTTGLRKGELCGLRWKDVDLARGVLHIQSQWTQNGLSPLVKSGNSARSIHLDKDTLAVFKEMKESEYKESMFVFAAHSVLFNSLTTYLTRHFDLTAHDLRHTHATDLLSIMNYADAAYRMGHTTEEYIRTYVHRFSDNVEESMEKMSLLSEKMFCDKSIDKPRPKVIKLSQIKASRG